MSGDLDDIIAAHSDEFGSHRDSWKRRALGMPVGKALAMNKDHKMLSVAMTNRLAGLAARRAADLGLSRTAYVRALVAADVATAYDLDAEPLHQPPGKVGQHPKDRT